MTAKRLALFLAVAATVTALAAAIVPQTLYAEEIILPVSATDPNCVQTSDPPCFRDIQAAINFANDLLTRPTPTTDTFSVRVEPGTYPGGITLRNNIDIRGRETARTVIDGAGGTAITASGTTNADVFNFTFVNAAVGISVSNATIAINNNVFFVGTSGTAIQVQNATGASLVNNTFFQNGTAISSNSDIVITNNIFSENTIALSTISPLLGFTRASFNDYHVFSGGTVDTAGFVLSINDPNRGTNIADVIENPAHPNPDPRFVSRTSRPPNLDLHLLEDTQAQDSPCIDTGTDVGGARDSFDGTRTDIGAYGGPSSDTIPFPVTIQSAAVSAAATNAIDVTWSQNLSYLVTNTTTTQGSYKVYFSLNRQGAPYDSSVTLSSSATTTTLTDLNDIADIPATPVLLSATPAGSGALEVVWSAAAGATGYLIDIIDLDADPDAAPLDPIELGNVTSHTITGLVDGHEYSIAVLALAQNAYSLAVTALDNTAGPFDPGVEHESAFSPEVTVLIGDPEFSEFSNEITAIPEAIAALPNLPNSGCFIATAAYGHYSAPQVQALRDFRDRYLLTNAAGRAFVRWYYAHSPAAARFISDHPALRAAARTALAPFVLFAWFMTQAPALAKAAVFLLIAALILGVPRALRKPSHPRKRQVFEEHD